MADDEDDEDDNELRPKPFRESVAAFSAADRVVSLVIRLLLFVCEAAAAAAAAAWLLPMARPSSLWNIISLRSFSAITQFTFVCVRVVR